VHPAASESTSHEVAHLCSVCSPPLARFNRKMERVALRRLRCVYSLNRFLITVLVKHGSGLRARERAKTALEKWAFDQVFSSSP